MSNTKVGCDDGCGTRVVSIESLQQEIKQLRADVERLTIHLQESQSEANALTIVNDQLRARLDAAMEWVPVGKYASKKHRDISATVYIVLLLTNRGEIFTQDEFAKRDVPGEKITHCMFIKPPAGAETKP